MQGEDATENPRRDVEDHWKEGRIGDEAKATLKQLVTEEQIKLVEDFLHDILRVLYNKA